MEQKLSELKTGDKAEIISVKAAGEIRRRLIDMGVSKGLHIKVIRKAPLGDPIEIMFKGCCLTLRVEEAAQINVIKLGEVGDGKPMGKGRMRRKGCGHG